MDRQVAYDLFIAQLERRGIKGIDLRKEIPGLLAWGFAKGVFANPHAVHELSEWRLLGDKLWEAVLEDDKTAKKLGKIWQMVHNTLLQQIAEKKAAERAVEAHKKNLNYGQDGEPLAPGVTQVLLPIASKPACTAADNEDEPTAPPEIDLQEEGDWDQADRQPKAQKNRSRSLSPAFTALQHLRQESDPIPGALSDLREEMARQRREAWANVARRGLEEGDEIMIEAANAIACPVTYTPQYDQNGQVTGHLAEYSPLDWKLLTQLRQTVAQFGFKSEPVKQILDYMFDTMLLLPNDLRGISKLIFTQHQQLLFNAHWQAMVNESIAVQRAQGDPLHGVTVDELMGLGLYLRTEAQMLIGADKVREAMRLVRAAIDRVKDTSGVPMYMGIKQGQEESFGSFIDKAAAAIERAGVPEYMRGALLKQCALQNSNDATKRVLATLGANWTIEEALERMALQPTGPQVFLVDAIKELGLGLQKQAESTQAQVLAALAPLRAPTVASTAAEGGQKAPSLRCYRCGKRRTYAASVPCPGSMVPELPIKYSQHFRMSPAAGKLVTERQRPRDTNCRSNSTTSCLQPATAGSLGLDLAAAVDVTLMTSHPVKISTGVHGPLRIQDHNYGALLIGRSSVSIMGLFVLPGIIDADYTGEIQIMAHTPFPPLAVKKGQRIAQLIPLPQLTSVIPPNSVQNRGNKGFGSSGIACLTMDLHTRPKKQDAAGKVLDRWAIMSREEEIITLQQFLRFGETKSIVELMAIQEKEGQAVAVPSSKTDSDIRTFIESNNRTRSPSLLAHLENSNPSSIHHFENIPNSLAFLLPFQYINPVSAPLLGLPPNGLLLEQPAMRLREPSLTTQNEYNESSESEVSPTPFKNEQASSRNALTSITNVEPKTEPACVSPVQTPTPVNDLSKTEHTKSSFRIHRMRRMGSASRKGRVFCNACGKTFYDKGTLKIHYNAVHLKIKHRCTIEGCNMVFSSLRSRNRHSANPNPRLHMPMLRNNRDKDLIRATSGAATPVIASTKSNLTLTSPGRPPMGFTTPPLDPVLQNPLPSQLVFPALKTVQPVPPFYRNLLTPGEMVSPPTSLPTSPIIPAVSGMEQHPPPPSESSVPSVLMPTPEPNADLAPKKKPRKSSMPVKIEKEVIDTADEFDDEDEEVNDRSTMVNDIGHDNHCHSQEEMSPGLSVKDFSKSDRGRCMSRPDIRRADSMTSEDQEHERDYENESESSEPKLCEESLEGDDRLHEPGEKSMMHSDRPDENHNDSSNQDVIKVKEEYTDPTYDMFYMSQYGLYNGGSASMAALHESFASTFNYSSPQKFSPEGEMCSSPDPKICYVCKKSFKSSYSVKLHYRNVHLKEMHVCTVAGCNAAFPSRRSRDRHSANINLHRKLLTKELDDMGLDTSQPSLSKDLRDEFLVKIYGAQHQMGLDIREDTSSPAGTEDSHMNGYGRGMAEDYMVLDLSTTSSIQSSSSIHSSRESDAGSDEGILLDDVDGASDSGESAHKADAPALAVGMGTDVPGSLMFNSVSVSNGGIMCNICHKMYSNKGTLRVHYKTVHLREMHKCKVPGCNMMFSSVRSRNRHSQNPNLHKNIPFTSVD
ncbi:zinc finger protein basonuclin-2 [Camarhynchus parvulus]|uniref:zinc finger protein basonuclin-2 n=1 Tax=Geospiza parvula TaxID=87175 RepID=UPI001237B048|nr:zinc finger protein basonuclin-2 [Camarhynchus parvulus]